MNNIHWGIIGCGDVTEVKSGPAFNKVPHSSLVAVMRRNEEKAKDYAQRHHVPKWYTDAGALINDPAINAVYVATPPSSHEEYTIAALKAGKSVYVEKPMAVSAAAAVRMTAAAHAYNGKLVVAHYRRAQPLFQKIKSCLAAGVIGDVRMVRVDLFKRSLTPEELAIPKTAWRVNGAIAGGGLFHDLAPHQLDLLYYYFGDAVVVSGTGLNQAGLYEADDMVTGYIRFKNGVTGSGSWSFSVGEMAERDQCEITGSRGMMRFSFFDQRPLVVITAGGTEEFAFDPLPHVQQPMIDQVVKFFRNEGPNPCTGEEGTEVMRWLEAFTGK